MGIDKLLEKYLMIDEEFCVQLEIELSKFFAASHNNVVKHFWCDGVLLPTSEIEISQKNINDKREINTTVFVGVNGQEPYNLKLKFGNKALSRYARNLDIKECIPGVTSSDQYQIDIIKRTVTIYLL